MGSAALGLPRRCPFTIRREIFRTPIERNDEMKSIFFMLRQSRLMIAAAIAASVLSGVSTIALLASINRGMHHADALSSSTSVWGFVGLCAAALLTKIASDLILIRLAQRITLDLRTRL